MPDRRCRGCGSCQEWSWRKVPNSHIGPRAKLYQGQFPRPLARPRQRASHRTLAGRLRVRSPKSTPAELRPRRAARTASPSRCDPRRSRTSPAPQPSSPWSAPTAAPAWRSRAPTCNAMDRSFASSPMVKPASNFRDSTNCLNFFCVELFIPVAAFSTSDHHRRIEAETLADQQRLDADQEAAGADQIVQRLHRLAGADARRSAAPSCPSPTAPASPSR